MRPSTGANGSLVAVAKRAVHRSPTARAVGRQEKRSRRRLTPAGLFMEVRLCRVLRAESLGFPNIPWQFAGFARAATSIARRRQTNTLCAFQLAGGPHMGVAPARSMAGRKLVSMKCLA